MMGFGNARQRGATLAVALIMLVLITLMLLAAFTISSSNFRAVTNMQFRDEAIAAADRAIQQVVDSSFTDDPAATDDGPFEIDLNNDGLTDYLVQVAVPQCVSATIEATADPSSLSLPIAMSAESTWNTVWDIDATVSAADNIGGASVRVRSGVRVLLSESEMTTSANEVWSKHYEIQKQPSLAIDRGVVLFRLLTFVGRGRH